MNTTESSHLGRKILYSLVIAASGLIALLCAAGIIGGWALESKAEKAAITALKFVETSAGAVRQAIDRVDVPLAGLEGKTADIADASRQLSQNVSDKGLVMVLLPEEKEQELTAAVGSVRDTLSEVRGTISTGVDLYRTVDRMPFISLPGLSSDQLDKIDGGVSQVQALGETLRSQVRDVRSGAAGAVDKVQATVALLSAATGEVRDRLAELDTRLTAMQVRAVQLQQAVPTAFVTIAVLLSLLLAFVIFTQVEVIRLYIRRWRMLGQAVEAAPAAPQETAAP
jgi:hypothetical protein